MADIGNEIEYLPAIWRQSDCIHFATIFEGLMSLDANGIVLIIEEKREWCRGELERLYGFEPGEPDYRYCAYSWMKSCEGYDATSNPLLHSLMNAVAVIGRIGKGNS